MTSLFEPTRAGDLQLPNRIAMAPLTRNRAPDAIPTPLMATYYAQRASAGLIISEAVAISPQAQGYADVPGLYSTEQLDGWKKVTRAVHDAGGKIVVQLWHVGRDSHTSLHPANAPPVAPSATRAHTKTVLIKDGVPTFTETSQPRALDAEEIPGIVQDYRHAARHAIAAGFDGVEIHAANGYLIDQFLQDRSNQRTDAYGGPIENRMRLLLEIVDAAIEVWGAGRVGVHLAPRGDGHDMGDSDPQALFTQVARELGRRGVAFLCLREHLGAGRLLPVIREAFGGAVIANEGLDPDSAAALIERGEAEAVAFGRLAIANPDLVERIRQGAALNQPDPSTFYGGGEAGYTDFPALG
ncbi:alkene reductase [Sphaerotilus sulfidivorans]